MDYNISASGMKSALEMLSTIKTVDVSRDLYCSEQSGINSCGYERGYVWKVTFINVINNGDLTEEYLSYYATQYGHRLSVSGEFLRACVGLVDDSHEVMSKNQHCITNSSTNAFVESYQEIQDICLCDIVDSIGKLNGVTFTIPANRTAQTFTTILESFPQIGHVTINSYPVAGYGSCGCTYGATVFEITFDTLMGDVMTLQLTSGTAREKVKGQQSFVRGVGDYSIYLDTEVLNLASSVYVRVTAENSVGLSNFASPFLNPVVLYSSQPSSPSDIAVSVVSHSKLLVSWKMFNLGIRTTNFIIEYDTTPTFSSQCGSAICQSIDSFPQASLTVTNGSVHSYIIDHLIPGQPYYIRIKSCYTITSPPSYSDTVCSEYSYYGFPNTPLSVYPVQVPPTVGYTTVTPINSSTFALDWESPNYRSRGANGQPITSYSIEVSSPVSKVVSLIILDPTSSFIGSYALKDTSSITRCISFNSTQFEIEVKIEDLARKIASYKAGLEVVIEGDSKQVGNFNRPSYIPDTKKIKSEYQNLIEWTALEDIVEKMLEPSR
jgi:hypothetical protein